jgi:DNA-binding SARP family transcriptional activator
LVSASRVADPLPSPAVSSEVLKLLSVFPSLTPGFKKATNPTGLPIQVEVFLTHKLQVLGPPQVLDDAGAPVSLSLGKPLAVLIYVACSTSPVSRDHLADLLWPDADRQKGRHSVRQALWVLKNALGDDIFLSHDPLSLREGTLAIDLTAFSEALLQGRVEEARALWRGPVLDHFVLAGVRHWNHWTEDLRGDLERRFCTALLKHAQIQAAGGDAAGAVSVLDQAIEVAPASEAPHLARIGLLLDLLRLEAAREAIADAHRTLGDQPGSVARLAAMEERLQQVIQEQRARVEEGDTFPMEFVGRSRELAGLHALWRDANIGLTRVAVVTGPSGIGKTRLAQELLAYVSGNEIRTVALKGTRAGMKLRWGTASDMVRELLRLPGSAGISSASDSLLRAMLPSMGTRAVDLQTVNGVSPAAILDAVTDLMEAVTFEAQLVILVDDFQWMDPDSRTLFLGLANRCREQRVLFLILGRSDLSSRHWEEVESSLVTEAGARAFLLKPLIEEEVGELLALGAAFPDSQDAQAVVGRIHQVSAGNPLFIREILKELHEKEILVREGPGWIFQTSQIPDTFELPENIRVLLHQRLDRLSEAGANLAATLAKANRKVPPETLRRDTQLPETVFTQAVAELLERGVIEWVGGTSLDFVHDVLRDTATSHLSGSLPGSSPKSSLFRKTWFRTGATLVVLLGAALWALWGRGLLPWEREPVPPPHGGGTIVLLRGEDTPRALKITQGPVEEVESVELDPAPPPRTRSMFRAHGEDSSGSARMNQRRAPIWCGSWRGGLVPLFSQGQEINPSMTCRPTVGAYSSRPKMSAKIPSVIASIGPLSILVKNLT